MDTLVRGIQTRSDQEICNVHELIGRKANLEDISGFRKEMQYKLEKGELEAFRQEFVDRVAAFDR
jgi:hypothetical protein